MSSAADAPSSGAHAAKDGVPTASAGNAPSSATSSSLAAQSSAPGRSDDHQAAHHSLNSVNLTLLDPARWGWTAAGGVADLLPPHERARRREAKHNFLLAKRKLESASTEGSHATRSFWMLDNQGSQALPEQPAAAAADSQAVSASSSAGASSKKPKGGAGKKRRGSTTTRDSSSNKSKSQRSNVKPIRFSALWGDSVLDMYTYHRGREGVELRDEDTGDLLCDVEATDTSHGATDAPNLVAQVTVEFPLDDVIPDGHAEPRKFRQVVHWELGDPATAPPMVFAADVAAQFGLSYRQTLELSESIERQINTWMRNHCGHSQPLVLKDAAGSNREPPISTIYSLYGFGSGSAKGGRPQPSQQAKKKASAKQSMRGLVSRSAGTLELAPPGTTKGHEDDQADAKSKGSAKGSAKRRNGAKIEPTPMVEEYVLEVRRRLRDEASERMKSNPTEKRVADEARSSSDRQCHVCQEKVAAGSNFACEYDHTFCDAHQPEPFQAANHSEPTPLLLECCPVCVLECACPTCSSRLHAVALLFKTKCAEQGVSAAEASMENLLEVARNVKVTSGAARRYVGKRKIFEAASPRISRVVPKVPVSEFPREVCNGVDLDPGSEADYLTVYSASGATLSQGTTAVTGPTIGQDPPAIAALPQEDGSIDYCIVCGKHGHLLCCDFCPRAFHSSCVDVDDVDDKSDSPWQCHSCKKEHLGLPEETFDGSGKLDRIIQGYKTVAGSGDVPEEDLKWLKSIAILREMLDYLMNFSFGHVFKFPVDPTLVPAYSAVIKNPMDLGTVASRIDDGTYFKRLPEGGLEVVLSAIVQDVELVWRNCFTFNFPGSAIYRMAEVQRKAAVRAITNSLDASVIEKLKGDIDVAAPLSRSEAERTSPAAVPTDEKLLSQQKARHKISVPTKGSKCRRAIAVLDPDSGRIIKIYSSLQAASAAIDLFIGLKYECERDLEGLEIYPKVRVFVKDGAKDPSFLLFGYRWLWLDELRSGKVSFKKAGGISPIRGVGESKTKPKKLKKSPSSVRGPSEGSSSNHNDDESCTTDVWAVTKNSAGNGDVLAKFKSVEEAYTDWLTLLDGSLEDESETRTLQFFTSYYLDKDRTIGGAVWKTYLEPQRRVTDSPKRLPPETAKYLKTWITSSELVNYPYPTEEEKAKIVAATGIELKQLSNWLGNHRQRYWKVGRTVSVQGTIGMTSTGSPSNGDNAGSAIDNGANPSLELTFTASSPDGANASPASRLFLPGTADE